MICIHDNSLFQLKLLLYYTHYYYIHHFELNNSVLIIFHTKKVVNYKIEYLKKMKYLHNNTQ